jgi:hypothetical protein
MAIYSSWRFSKLTSAFRVPQLVHRELFMDNSAFAFMFLNAELALMFIPENQ